MRKRRKVNYDGILTVRLPLGLKEWYDRRATEQGVSTGQLVREILQFKRETVKGTLIIEGDLIGYEDH